MEKEKKNKKEKKKTYHEQTCQNDSINYHKEIFQESQPAFQVSAIYLFICLFYIY